MAASAEDDAIKFGQLVRQKRKARQWTLETLSAEALLKPDRKGYISLIDRGKIRNITVETVKRIAQALQIDRENVPLALQWFVPTKRVFVVLASQTEEAQVEFQECLKLSLRANELQPAFYFPRGHYIANEQDIELTEIIKNKHDFIGGIIVCVDAVKRHKQHEAFARRFQKPLVFTDISSLTSEYEFSPWTAYVGTTAAASGRLAARAAFEFAGVRNKLSDVLVLAGNLQQDRQLVFKDLIKEKFPECNVTVDIDCEFVRVNTRKVALKWFKNAKANKRRIDLVFCNSDSITLGCLDAVRDFEWGKAIAPKIIGLDGIAEVKNIVSSGDSPIIRVVVQDSCKTATVVVETLLKMTKGKDVSERIIHIEPYLYPTAG